MEKQIAAVLPKHLNASMILKGAMVAAQRTPKLYQCSAVSVMNSLMTCGILGLDPSGVLGEAYLIPFDRKRNGVYSHTECQVIIGYQGMIGIARRSGEIESIAAVPVFEGDEIDINLGTDPYIKHKPAFEGDRTSASGLKLVYFVGRFRTPDGKSAGFHTDWMSRSEIDAIRKRSKASDDGPWVTDPIEMARKTMIRRAWKYLPKSTEVLASLAERAAEGTDAGALRDFIDVPADPSEEAPADPAPQLPETNGQANPLPGVFSNPGDQPAAATTRAASTASKLRNGGQPPSA